MAKTFTKMYNDYFGHGLTSDEIIIISIINSYTENDKPCYVTDEQFACYINKSRRSVQYIIAELEQMHVITRTTALTSNNGQKSRIRTLTVNDVEEWLTEGSAKFAIPYAEGSAKNDNKVAQNIEGSAKNDNKVAQNTTKGSATDCDIQYHLLDNKQYCCANAQADAGEASSAPAQNEKAINALQQWMGADSATATKYHGKIHKELTNNDIIGFLANTNKTAKDYQAQRKFGIDDFAVWFCEQVHEQASLPG